MRNRVRLLEGGSRGQSSAEPACRRGSHIPSARRLEPVHVAVFRDPVSAGEAVLGEGDLSPGTRVLIARGPSGHRTPCEGRGGEGRSAATHQGAPKITQPPEPPEGARPCSHPETRENSPGLSQATPRVALPYSGPRRPMHAPLGSRNSRVQSPSGAQGGRSEASCIGGGRVFH